MLVVTNFALNEKQEESILAVSPKVELARVKGDSLDAYQPYLDRMEVGFCMMRMPADVLKAATGLRWLHTSAAGVDGFETSGMLNGPFTLTTSNGLHRVQMAEHILCMMLMWNRDVPRLLKAQAEHRWLAGPDRPTPVELWGKTLGIVGLGNIGDETARRARAFGMRVVASKRSLAGAARPDYVDELLPASDLQRLLQQSDYVLLSLPLTGESRGLIGEAELRSMKPSSFIVNISRGAIFDDAALLRALREGWIGGAALDVFSPEPPPADSPFWDLPNVIVTPHISGPSERYNERCVDIFRQNLERYVAGQPLLNVYDATRGY